MQEISEVEHIEVPSGGLPEAVIHGAYLGICSCFAA